MFLTFPSSVCTPSRIKMDRVDHQIVNNFLRLWLKWTCLGEAVLSDFQRTLFFLTIALVPSHLRNQYGLDDTPQKRVELGRKMSQ